MNLRLSHSAISTLLVCERKFQLDRLLLGGEDEIKDWPATVMGHAYGAGVSTYLLTADPEKALFAAYNRYWPILEDDKRTEEILLNLLICSFPSLDNLLMDWTVAIFENKPAVELSFRLNDLSETEHDIYFVGYVDVVLKNRWTNKSAILEVKTTGIGLHDIDPLFKNSGQALGYSIVLDRIMGEAQANYDVIYLVAQTASRTEVAKFSPTIHVKEYPKTIQDRLNWFISLGMDVNRLEQMLALSVFPMRGNSCLQYMRPCKHFGTCHLQTLDRPKPAVEDLIEYQFVYSLRDLIADHIQRS